MDENMLKPRDFEVIIIFRVHAPFATSTERVWLLGSLPELGEWNPTRAIETGQVEGEWKVWQARVRLPMNCSFQWSWCILFVDGRLKQWEAAQKRERRIFSFSGVLHTSWGDPTVEIFLQNMGSAKLVTQRRAKKGDVVAVIGSSPALGSWDPSKAVAAREYPPKSGRWAVTVYYDSGAMLEWNWIIIDKETKEVKLKEKRKTRFLYESHGWIKLDAPWNKDAQAVDWTHKEHCGVGHVNLGTVELINIRRSRQHEIRRWEEKAEWTRLAGSSRVTATLQLESPLPPRMPLSPRVVDSPSFDSEWSESHKPDMLGPESAPAPKALLPSIAEDFQPVLKIKPYSDQSPCVDATSRKPIISPFFPPTAAGPAKVVSAPRPAPATPPTSSRQIPTMSAKPLTTPPPTPKRQQQTSTPKASPQPSIKQQPPQQQPQAMVPQQRTQQVLAPAQHQERRMTVSGGEKHDASITPEDVVGGEDRPRRYSDASTGVVAVPKRKEEDKMVGLPLSRETRAIEGPGTSQPHTAPKTVSKNTSKESVRSVAEPVDITKVGYTMDPQCPVRSKGDRTNLVSYPGRPGFSHQPQNTHAALLPLAPPVDLTGPMLDHDKESFAPRPGETQSLDELPLPQTEAPGPFISPPVRRPKDSLEGVAAETASAAAGAQRTSDGGTCKRRASVTSNTSVMSNMIGALFDDTNKPQPNLEDLRMLSEQREQAKTSDRLQEIMDREERNRSKFRENKQMEFQKSYIKKTHTPKKDQSSGTPPQDKQ